MNIHRGEQFVIFFDVFVGDRRATDETVDGIRIKLGNRMLEWPNGDLAYDSENMAWRYPLTEEQSSAMYSGQKMAQVAVMIGDAILMTDVIGVVVKNSIITERWMPDG